MKKIIGYPTAWILFWLGDFVSRIPNFNYSIYNALMIWSNNVQEWSVANGPWEYITNGGTIDGFSEDVVIGDKIEKGTFV